MKYTSIILLILFVSCSTDTKISDTQIKDFQEMAQTYQTIYNEGSENCDQILAAIDENIEMWENGRIWSYSELEKFCPHLPKKNVVQTYNDQTLLDKNLGFDFVSQSFVIQNGDTMRETSSRLWQKKGSTWKIVKMKNLISRK